MTAEAAVSIGGRCPSPPNSGFPCPRRNPAPRAVTPCPTASARCSCGGAAPSRWATSRHSSCACAAAPSACSAAWSPRSSRATRGWRGSGATWSASRRPTGRTPTSPRRPSASLTSRPPGARRGYSKVTEIGAVRMRGLQHRGALHAPSSTRAGRSRRWSPASRGSTTRWSRASPRSPRRSTHFVAFAGPGRAGGPQRPLRPALPQLRAAAPGGPLLHPALARHARAGAPAAERPRAGRHDLGDPRVWADTTVRPTHRALPDAEATAEVLVALIGLLAERGDRHPRAGGRFAGIGGARHAYKLALAEDLPATPGVYVMRDRAGDTLYVGKAGNIRRRVRSYFGPGGRHGRLIGRALDELESIHHESCGSEFAALLLENRLIKELRPPCNQRGNGAAGQFLKLAVGPRGARLYLVARPRADAGRLLRPGPTRRASRGTRSPACGALYPMDDPDPGMRERTADSAAARPVGRALRARRAGRPPRGGRRLGRRGGRPRRAHRRRRGRCSACWPRCRARAAPRGGSPCWWSRAASSAGRTSSSWAAASCAIRPRSRPRTGRTSAGRARGAAPPRALAGGERPGPSRRRPRRGGDRRGPPGGPARQRRGARAAIGLAHGRGDGPDRPGRGRPGGRPAPAGRGAPED